MIRHDLSGTTGCRMLIAQHHEHTPRLNEASFAFSFKPFPLFRGKFLALITVWISHLSYIALS
jgi:hypothetical protein